VRGAAARISIDCVREVLLRSRQISGIERHRAESQLDPTKTLASFDFAAVPMLSKAHVMALASGDAWLEKGATILIFGPPGVGKSHVGCGIGHALIDAGYRVLYMRTSELVQRLQAARQNLQLPQALIKLDRYDLLILDDIGYVQHDRAEMEVLFALLAERYERKSVMITSNLVFSKWDQIFKDPMTTMAAIDRLVHHATILEFDGESVRAKKAKARSTT